MKRRAFSLVELLVVIGIVVVLVSIAIPVISRVRQAAYAASTQSQIAVLVSAIERYSQDFRSYPGPLPNNQINELAPGTYPQVNGILLTGINTANGGYTKALDDISMSENLVLGLLGGLRFDGTTFVFDSALVGGGPSSLNPANPRRYSPYLDAAPAWLSPGQFIDQAGRVAFDTTIPEFVDQFPSEPLPILYLRASTGRSKVVDRAFAHDDAQYTLDQVTAYTLSGLGIPTGKYHGLRWTGGIEGTDGLSTGIDGNGMDGLPYLSHPSLPDTPRQKDGYILISAGKDRVYGTNDDITNFGSVK